MGVAQQARETFAWGTSYAGVGITPVLFAAFKEVVGAGDAYLPIPDRSSTIGKVLESRCPLSVCYCNYSS